MSRKTVFLLLIALLVVTGVIFLLLPGDADRDEGVSDSVVLSGLESRVNDVDRVVVVTAGGATAVTLLRDDQGWQVEELAGYPADLKVMRDVLGALAQATVIEAKTANPDYYARLGVEDVSGDGAGGLRLDLAAGEETWSVIVGDEAPRRDGRYLRVAGHEGSVLADFTADVPETPAGWADATVIDLMAGEVAEVRLTRPGGGTLTAVKISADETDFSLAELPEGRETRSAWAVNALGNALSTLEFESVAPVDSIEWDSAIEARAVRFDGLEVTAQLRRSEADGDWLRVQAAAPFVEAAGDDNLEVVAAADAINARVAGWAYRIPGHKATAMDKQLEDLLKPLPEEGEDAG